MTQVIKNMIRHVLAYSTTLKISSAIIQAFCGTLLLKKQQQFCIVSVEAFIFFRFFL